MKTLSNLFYLLKGFFFPSACALCGQSLLSAQEIKFALCESCNSEITGAQNSALIREREQKCGLCGKPLISEQGICLPCRNGKEKPWDRFWVLFPYAGKYRKLLSEYKFSKNLALVNLFAHKALEVIASNAELENAVIVPVPPRAGKIKDSGWDQVDYLVRKIMKLHSGKIAVSRCLKRKKSRVQKKLSRSERAENLKGRIFHYGEVPRIALVIDDVITTGSTMEVCCASLKEAKADKVYGFCLFYD